MQTIRGEREREREGDMDVVVALCFHSVDIWSTIKAFHLETLCKINSSLFFFHGRTGVALCSISVRWAAYEIAAELKDNPALLSSISCETHTNTLLPCLFNPPRVLMERSSSSRGLVQWKPNNRLRKLHANLSRTPFY